MHRILGPACLPAMLLTGCAALQSTPAPLPVSPPAEATAAPAGPPHVAILLPLTGPNAALGTDMLNAAQLALSAPGGPPLDVRDTAGDPARAAQQAGAAIAAGDRLILGPLTAAETASVADAASQAAVPVLAFTSDPAAARPGVWTLGLGPGEQMRRLVAAARDDGRQHLAAILPQGAFGDAIQTALVDAAETAGFPYPEVHRDDGSLDGFTAALKTVTAYDQRRGEVDRRIQALRSSTDPADRQQAVALAAEPPAPVPFDSLVLAESGSLLPQIAGVLPAYDIAAPQVRVLGPALWAPYVGRLGALAGAWYVALDDAARPGYVHAFELKYGRLPAPLADLAFDAAAIARVVAAGGDLSTNALTRPEGFTGVDGALLLLADGHVRRALAVYQITPGGGARVVSPAPTDLSSPPS